MADVNRYSIEQTTNFLASFLPEGKALLAKTIQKTNLRKYLIASSQEFKRINDEFATLLEDIDPRITINFIEEWESALGIPDDCIPISDTDQERRDNIVLKLSSLSIQTEDDYRELAAQFGFTIMFNNDESFPFTFPFTFSDPGDCGGFPYTFEFNFDSGEPSSKFDWCISGDFSINPDKATIFKCLVQKLAPSNIRVTFLDI